MASALLTPVAISTIFLAFIIEANPIVIALVGTSLIELKKRELSIIVDGAKSATWVKESNDVPGSLKAMWPSEPIPKICKSIPPALAIFSSYSLALAS